MADHPTRGGGADAPPPLVSAAWLAMQLGRGDLLVLDIRSAVDGGGREAYEAAHVPGAVHSDYGKDGWRAARGPAAGALPEPAALAALFGRLGLEPRHHVVIVPAGVSAGDFSAAARVYWTLKVAGHARLSILDGGFAAWRADGSRPVESGPSPDRAATRYPVALRPQLQAEVARVEAAVAHSSETLLDGRSEAHFEGREKSPQAARPGRLPGAIHLDHALAYDGTRNGLRQREELERLFAAVPAGPVISYCNTGHLASTNWFVLSEVLRRPDVSLYDGSMSEWTADERRPVATGA
ncbi:rhodanese-like domain-containing protein [Chelatococcus sp. SYSU_G07232]|uniref:Rhodanese-like domain-containing protein n=2 Tax=Chelatococcus albus TaxID=3047466 RepID=A0ABT7AJU3_9HYPH|nr:rhodanese-like domain-containing protein [Chelatococcus sp. SYSU_G07232]